MKKVKRKLCLLSVLIMLVSFSSNSLAYRIMQYSGINCGGVLDGYIVFQSWSGLTNETRWAIDYASRQWNTRTGNTVLYHSSQQHDTNIASQYDGKNLITKVPMTSWDDENTLMLTTSWVRSDDPYKYHIESDIEINSLKSWYNNGSMNGYDIQNVMTHEFGHMLGLDDLNNYTESEYTMYHPVAYGETKKRTLEQDDLNGFYAIYS